MQTEQKEIISPEGVEERVVQEQTFRITLTGGGKYRAYWITGDGPQAPAQSFATLDEAEKSLAVIMTMIAGLKISPDKTLDALFSALTKHKGA